MQTLLAFESAQNRIVDARLDAAIVQDEVIGEFGETRGFLILADDGLFGEIAAGHH